MKLLAATLLTFVLTVTTSVYAHGEDKLGPNKGYIRMPGPYHIEVVPLKNKLNVVLLDLNLKNPTVLNSFVKVRVTSGSESYMLHCEPQSNYFSCPVNSHLLKQIGTLKIESERQLTEGISVEYPLPLRLKKSLI